MRRVLDLLDRWLPALACLCGAVIPAGEAVPYDEPGAAPDLDEQLHELFAHVIRQEKRWRTEPVRPRRVRGRG
jgi:hypothetical protein